MMQLQATEIDTGTSSPKGTAPALATVILIAADVNDNSPTFISDHIFGSVSELSRVGDFAAAGLQAFDIDEVCMKIPDHIITSTIILQAIKMPNLQCHTECVKRSVYRL